MGLFSFAKNILHAVSPIAGAVIGAHDNKKAIGKALDATQLGITNATGALTDQLGLSTNNFAPYTNTGVDALGQNRDILGLNGTGAQGSVIEQLKASPLFQALFRTGQDTVLNNASATGGLRGGNVQSSLANFGSDTLSQVIQQQLQNLSPLITGGQQATGTLAGLGANTATQVAGLDTDAGSANAGAILGKQAVRNNMFDQIQKMIQQAASGGAGGGGGSSFLSGIALPAGMSGLPF